MRVADVMTRDVVAVGPEMPIVDVAQLLLDKHISAVPVIDIQTRVVGIVSEADLMRRPETSTERQRPWWLRLLLGNAAMASEYVRAHGRKASDVMTRSVVSVTEDKELGDVVRLLERHRIKRVPVVAQDGKLLGIVSRANLVRGLLAMRGTIEASSSDRVIRAMILEELKKHPWATIRADDILVVGGVVSFWGVVGSEEERDALRVLAENIPGVRKVEDYSTVQPIYLSPLGGVG